MRIVARDYIIPDPPPAVPGALMGWEKTPENVGLASVGVTDDLLEPVSLNPFGGNRDYPNASGEYYRKIFSQQVAAAPGTLFEQCKFTGSATMVVPCGDEVVVLDSDMIMVTPWDSQVGTHVNIHPYTTGSVNTKTYLKNIRMTGGTIFINATMAGALIEDVYGYGQLPESGGGQHRDGFTSRGCREQNPIIVNRCRFDCDQNSTTGALFLQNTYGDEVIGFQSYNSLYEGSGYNIVIDNALDTVMVNNRTNPHGNYTYSDYTVAPQRESSFASWKDNYRYNPEAVDGKGFVLPIPA